MRKSPLAIEIAMACLSIFRAVDALHIKAPWPQGRAVSNRHTGKAAERRNAKRRRRAKK